MFYTEVVEGHGTPILHPASIFILCFVLFRINKEEQKRKKKTSCVVIFMPLSSSTPSVVGYVGI
jgi:hypothetical protein